MSLRPDFRTFQCLVQTPHLLMKPFSEDHLTDIYAGWLNDPVVCRYNRHGRGTYTLERARAYLANLKSSDDTLVWALHEKESGRHVGNISLNDIDWNALSGEISILIGDPSVWGRNFGTEAVTAILETGFEKIGLVRQWVGFAEANRGMKGIAEKLGFRFFRKLPGAFVKEGHEPQAIEEWEMTAEAWRARNH